MNTTTIDAALYRRMLCAAAAALQAKKNEVNRLNVFPVPDGDTGTNMHLTMDAARNAAGEDLSACAEAAAKAVMRAARGNSGVILSLFFRGMAASLAGQEAANSAQLLAGFRSGADAARKAVMKPVEGTILTVMRECAEFEPADPEQPVETTLQTVLTLAQASLKRTPELLPTLKKAGVVDSGGYGFTIVVSGMLAALTGEAVNTGEADAQETEYAADADFAAFSEEDITFSFCTECLINRKDGIPEEEIDALRPFLNELGDSLVLVADNEIVKVHVHTNEPMTVLSRMLEFGVPQFIKVENMRQQHNALVTSAEQSRPKAEPLKEACGVVAVANGDGLRDLFKELGVGYVIAGGQSMNPSAEDFLKAIKALRCSRVILLPNNSNIVLAARQAAELAEGVQVDVLPTVTIPQGISAMLGFDSAMEQEELLENMNSLRESVTTLAVTRAAKDADIDGVRVLRKQYIGLVDNKLAYSTDTLEACLTALAEQIGDKEIITLYYGKSVKEKQAMAHAELLRSLLSPDQEVSVISGKQPIYDYLISAE